MRAGDYIVQSAGYRAFFPAALPPDPPIKMDDELWKLLSNADRALGRLDGITTILPNPELFVAMYVKQEALFSSQIEGTQSTLEEVLEYEISLKGDANVKDVAEVVNYVKAMKHGLQRLSELPVCLRLIKEVHRMLLQGVRGGDKTPGEFRTRQNWIGFRDSNVHEADFVPPPPDAMNTALNDFEKFLNGSSNLPMLIFCGLAHAQFETIHPFIDGNGRIGRLLITLLLCEKNVLQKPLLYLSYYLKVHKSQYNDRLMAIRNYGDWENWLKFFLRGVYQVSKSAAETAKSILHFREECRNIIVSNVPGSNGVKLLDVLFEHPILSVKKASEAVGCSFATASKLVGQFVRINILTETTGFQRNRMFKFTPYINIFNKLEIPLDSIEDGRSITNVE
jgi:Fic family protein